MNQGVYKMADLLNASELSQRVNEKLEELKKEEETIEETEETEKVEEKDSSKEKESNDEQNEENITEDSGSNKESVKEETEKASEESSEESSEKSEEELKQFATENNIPKSISLNVVKDWDKIPDEARKAMLKLANDADRFANTVKENQRAVSERNKELGTAMGYIKHTATLD